MCLCVLVSNLCLCKFFCGERVRVGHRSGQRLRSTSSSSLVSLLLALFATWVVQKVWRIWQSTWPTNLLSWRETRRVESHIVAVQQFLPGTFCFALQRLLQMSPEAPDASAEPSAIARARNSRQRTSTGNAPRGVLWQTPPSRVSIMACWSCEFSISMRLSPQCLCIHLFPFSLHTDMHSWVNTFSDWCFCCRKTSGDPPPHSLFSWLLVSTPHPSTGVHHAPSVTATLALHAIELPFRFANPGRSNVSRCRCGCWQRSRRGWT